jgi:TRAP-type C4-dicarboxylate transport system permease small subunit
MPGREPGSSLSGRIIGALNRIVGAAIILLFGLMLGLSTAQIALRFFFHTAIPWADTAARNLVLWIGLLGAVLATSGRQHFHLDLVTRFFGTRVRRIVVVAGGLFGAAACSALALAAVRFISVGIDKTDTAFLQVPLSTVAAIIPAAFGLMAIQFLLGACQPPAEPAQPASQAPETRA